MCKKLVIFSDVDGTMLGQNAHRQGPARDALQECLYLGIDIVLVSSKNRYEMMNIRRDLGISTPFIYENGGGLIVPRSLAPSFSGGTLVGSYWRLSWEGEIDSIRLALRTAAKEIGISVRPFGELSVSEIADITGLTQSEADLAKYRESDEPFLIVDETPGKLSSLKNQIVRKGFCYSIHGNFHHISGNFNKEDKVRFLKKLYMNMTPEVTFAGIGDGQNDYPMLRQTNHSFLVSKPGSSANKLGFFEGITITEGIGPEGFVEAINELIQEYYSIDSILYKGSLEN